MHQPQVILLSDKTNKPTVIRVLDHTDIKIPDAFGESRLHVSSESKYIYKMGLAAA